MKKTFKLFMATLVIGGIAFSFTSCSDKDVNDNGMEIPSDPYNKTSEEGSRLGDILGAIASLDSLPDNWQSKSFTVEPTIGRVLDESNPYVRTIASISQQEAIDIFNGFTGSELSSDATSQSWSKEGIGSFQLNTVNKDGVFATIDVNMPSVPHLTQIRFVDKSLLGENSSFKGVPYYHIGDVVKVTETANNVKEVSYWVCVRCCNSAYDKGKTHWVSFQLNNDNYKTFPADKDVAEMVVPTKLGFSSDTPRMLKYATQLFCLLTDPEDYDDLYCYEEGLGGLGKVTYSKSTIQNIARQWKEKGIADLVFPNDLTNTGDRFSPTFLNQKDTITFYCKGYSYWKNMSLYYTKVWKDRSKQAFCCKEGEDKWKPDAQKFDIKTYVSGGRRQWDGIYNPENRTAKEAFVVRYKTGAQLCKQSKDIYGNDVDPTKPLPEYNKKGIKITIEDAFHYDEKKITEFSIGDNVIDNDGAIWTCLLTPFDGYNNYVYVTMDNINASEDLLNITNTDLPTIEDVLKLYPLLYGYYSNSNDNFSRVIAALSDTQQGSGMPMDMYMQSINYKGGKARGYRTDFAIKSPDKKLRLMRMYADPCTNPQKGVIFKGFTTYQGSDKKIYLSDAEVELDEDEPTSDVIEDINRSDSLVCNFWPYNAEEPNFRDIPGSGKVNDYIYTRNTMSSDENFYSIFNAPIAIIRIRILQPEDKHDFKYYGSYDGINYNQLKSNIGKLLRTYLEAGRVFLDGASFKLSY